ncbi:MAG TPA: transposase, partial [Verrucomicrobiae bacterium]
MLRSHLPDGLGPLHPGLEWCGEGRPPCSRVGLAHADLAKRGYQFPTTRALIEALKTRPTLRRLCGGEATDDAPPIRAFSAPLAYVPIIDANPRGGEKIPFAPTHARRLGQRSASARVKSLLKERHGGRWVRGRGAAKVMCHLMFGWAALTATALFA